MAQDMRGVARAAFTRSLGFTPQARWLTALDAALDVALPEPPPNSSAPAPAEQQKPVITFGLSPTYPTHAFTAPPAWMRNPIEVTPIGQEHEPVWVDGARPTAPVPPSDVEPGTHPVAQLAAPERPRWWHRHYDPDWNISGIYRYDECRCGARRTTYLTWKLAGPHRSGWPSPTDRHGVTRWSSGWTRPPAGGWPPPSPKPAPPTAPGGVSW